jgi:diaminopimelate decarboxylase
MFFYKDGRLKIGDEKHFADVEEAARAQEGPSYFYDLDDIEKRFRALDQAFEGSRRALHFALKANSHPAVLKRLGSLGAGVDTVSGGEIRRALEAGIAPEKIIFSGVAKTVSEIEYAIRSKIKQINVESPQELERIQAIACRMGAQADVAFRMNPDVNPKTHPYITTGFRENKFGMDESFLPELIAILEKAKGVLRLRGLTMHIGSQLFEIDVMREALEKVLAVHRDLGRRGFQLDRIDIGGGLGIRYESDDAASEFEMIKAYGQMAKETIREALGSLNVEILLEPGRILVARAGLLVGEIQYIKKAPAKTFAILDTGMHHLLRPALYGAKHRVLPLRLGKDPARQTYDVVGPICESSDFLAKDASLPVLTAGERLALADAGAYGFTMASQYNSHRLPNELAFSQGGLVNG